jgi:hypothetical protein
MSPQEQKEAIYNEVYNRMAFNPEASIMERATQKTALYIVDLIMDTQIHIRDRYMELGFATYWTQVRQEIEKDIQAWKD